MNTAAIPSRALALVAAPLLLGVGTLGLTACGESTATPAQEPPLAGAAIGGDFALTGKDGETVRWGDFAGQYRIVYFGFTYCPDICPTDVQRTIQGLNQFTEDEPALGEQIQPLFISIDPERDTPEIVGEFASAFSDRLIGLTGTPEQIEDTAAAFKVFYSRGETSDDGAYLMNHSTIAYLFGPSGEPLATLPTDEGADAVADELAKWVI